MKGNQYIKKQKTTSLKWRLDFSDEHYHREALGGKRPISNTAWSIIARIKKIIIWNP